MFKKIIIAVIILAVAGFGVYKLFGKKEKAQAVNYAQVEAFRGSISEMIETTGEVSALNRVEIKPSVSGRVDQLLVDEGDSVKKGQILAYLSSNDRVAILDAVRTNENEDLAAWENTYKPTPVISPMDGKIILRAVVEGQTISTSDVLFALADELIVLASVDEADIGNIKVGQTAVVILDAYQDQKVKGKVFQILEEGKNVSNVITYYVKIRPNKVPSYYKSLMTANIEITVAEHKNAVLVPWLAVNEEKSGRTYVLQGDNTAQTRRDVVAGLADGTNIEILEGLEEGDKVLVKAAVFTGKQDKEKGSSSFIQMGGPRRTSNSELLKGTQADTQGKKNGQRSGSNGQSSGKPAAQQQPATAQPGA